jgi:hypothetical protein
MLSPRSAHQTWGSPEDVFLTGLFSNHAGKKKNIPIVMVGTIAAMPDEPVETDWCDVAAYLIDIRSFGGLSGSPVFAHTVESDPFDSILRQHGVHGTPEFIGTAASPAIELKVDYPEGWKVIPASPVRGYCLLGLMLGHFNFRGQKENMGIGIVIPITKILEVLDHPDFKRQRQIMADEYRQSKDGHAGQ